VIFRMLEISVNWLLILSQSSLFHIWNFFAQFCRSAFISFVSFCFLRGWKARIPTVDRRRQTVRVLTPPPKWRIFETDGVLNSTHSTPCTDIDTALQQHFPKLLSLLLPVFFALPDQNRVISSCCSPSTPTSTFSLCCKLFTARNFLANSAHCWGTFVNFFYNIFIRIAFLEWNLYSATFSGV